jgi:hypothetical protein
MIADMIKLKKLVYVGFAVHFALGVAVGFWTVILIKYVN